MSSSSLIQLPFPPCIPCDVNCKLCSVMVSSAKVRGDLFWVDEVKKRMNTLQVNFTCGYTNAASVPLPIKQAMYLFPVFWFYHPIILSLNFTKDASGRGFVKERKNEEERLYLQRPIRQLVDAARR